MLHSSSIKFYHLCLKKRRSANFVTNTACDTFILNNRFMHKKSTAPAALMSAKTVLLMRLQGLEPWTP